jgi:regulator of protease activity HflC (stomatin/prohibitin superfamily)
MADDALESSTTSTRSEAKEKKEKGSKKDKASRMSTRPLMEAATFSSDLALDHYEVNVELKVEDIVIASDFADQTADEQARTILDRFNSDVERSAFTSNPALGRALERVDISYFVLGHRNQKAELFDPRGQRYSTLFTADPKQTIKSLGPVLKTEAYYGAFGKHVLNVPAGHYACAFSKNRPVLYGEGPHVIIDPTFEFDANDGFVSQQEPYIRHSTINILRIPAGKVAKVWIGTMPYLYESRKDPYVIVDAQFQLVTHVGKKKGDEKLFCSASDSFIEHGSIKRIIPHTGEVAITYNNGILTIIPPPKDGKPVIIDSATHNFVGFISTALQTCLFPSKETKAQAAADNRKATADEINLKIFQTRDSLRVGVVLVVAFKIVDPELAITKLGRDGIIPHIENVSFADMGKAIQLSTLQEVMYFTQNKPGVHNAGEETSADSGQTIQDRVKSNLAMDLADYGIELSRLQIENMKVLDLEIAKQLAGQSVTSAEFTTKQATLVKEYDIRTTEARMKAETDNIALQQRNQAVIAGAQSKLDAAQREADALIVAADAQRKAAALRGELYRKYPALLEIERAKLKAKALEGATIFISPEDMAGFLTSPTSFFDSISSSTHTGATSATHQ